MLVDLSKFLTKKSVCFLCLCQVLEHSEHSKVSKRARNFWRLAQFIVYPTSFHKKLDDSRNQTSGLSKVESIMPGLQEKNQTPRRPKTIIGVHFQLNLHKTVKNSCPFYPFIYFCLYLSCFLTGLHEIWTESTKQIDKTISTIKFSKR